MVISSRFTRARLVGVGTLLGLLALTSGASQAQAPAAPPARAVNPSPKDLAPLDFTGYWVSVVSEDWRYRMVTPLQGDYGSVPLNREGRRVADTWRPEQAGRFDRLDSGMGAAARRMVWTPLKVVTTNLRAGWLRTNGVPYSAQAVVTEHFMRFATSDGAEWLTARTVVDDPA